MTTALLSLALLAAAPAAAQEYIDDAGSRAAPLTERAVADAREEGSGAGEDELPPLFKTGGKFTGGSGGYRGRTGYVQAGREWKLRATYSGYDYDGSTSTTHTGTLRASYQGEHLNAGVHASVTPLSQEYRSRGWGAELGWLFTPGDEDEAAWIDEWDVGAYWSQTRHQQTVLATPANPVQREIIVNQNDVGGAVSATAWLVTLSLDGYTSFYDQGNFGGINAGARNRPRLAAAADLVNSFPQDGQSARLDFELARWAVPYLSASRTSYVTVREPASWTVGGGVSLRLGDVGLEASFERNRQAGSDDQRYWSLGGSLRF